MDIATVDLDADVKVYTRQRGMWIAEQYADGDASLRELHEAHPDVVPAPFWVWRWRRDFPDFDLAMQDAEKVRAQNMADGMLSVADDSARTAAENRNRLKAREWLAERYDRERYGNAKRVDHNHGGSVKVDVAALTDDQLAMIAAQGRPAIEGTAERRQDMERARGDGQARPPTPPAARQGAPVSSIPSDPSRPTDVPRGTSRNK